jgi:hexosaminidase
MVELSRDTRIEFCSAVGRVCSALDWGNAPGGGCYAPNIFDLQNSTNNPPRDEPAILDHVTALWNDYGPNATVYSEAYYAWRNGLPALADKQWGGKLSEEQYDTIFDTLHAASRTDSVSIHPI